MISWLTFEYFQLASFSYGIQSVEERYSKQVICAKPLLCTVVIIVDPCLVYSSVANMDSVAATTTSPNKEYDIVNQSTGLSYRLRREAIRT
jgi:hypothetical protein